MSHLRHNHPAFVHVPEPIHVSPLIRAARWTALSLGLVYGFWRLRNISEKYSDLREFEFERKLAAAREKATQKKWLAKNEMRYLLKSVGIPFEEGVAQLGVEDLFRDE